MINIDSEGPSETHMETETARNVCEQTPLNNSIHNLGKEQNRSVDNNFLDSNFVRKLDSELCVQEAHKTIKRTMTRIAVQ